MMHELHKAWDAEKESDEPWEKCYYRHMAKELLYKLICTDRGDKVLDMENFTSNFNDPYYDWPTGLWYGPPVLSDEDIPF